MCNKPEFKPAYDFFQGPKILLREGQAKIQKDETYHAGEAQAYLELYPRPSIVLTATIQNKFLRLDDIQGFYFEGIDISGYPIEASMSTNTKEASRKTMIKWAPSSEPIILLGDDATKISEVIFHIFNFKDVSRPNGHSETRNKVARAISKIQLSGKNWRVEVKSLFESFDSFKQLKSEGGFKLTHVAKLTHVDNSCFVGKEAAEFLLAFRFFLSFAKGAWCNPVCAVGFDSDSNRVWEAQASPGEAWGKPPSWFDPCRPQQLSDLFPCFMHKWRDENWQKTLRESVYWYSRANNSSQGIDAGIILTQAAIERLSFEYAVNDKRLIGMEGFKTMRASDRFRLLFSSLNIPIDIASECPLLGKMAKRYKWADSPHALTEVRNSLVHPGHKRQDEYDKILYEAWNLGLWYLELIILRICGYSGSYGNRLKKRWPGEVDNVPWHVPEDGENANN